MNNEPKPIDFFVIIDTIKTEFQKLYQNASEDQLVHSLEQTSEYDDDSTTEENAIFLLRGGLTSMWVVSARAELDRRLSERRPKPTA